MNLLIVDDHLTNLKLLRAQLESEGHAVFEAHDGVDALALLERQRVDAVISDILMPLMDGYRLCYEIRKHARLRDLPIIIYSSTYTSPGDEKLALDMGADKYLRKPASVETIIAALHEAIAVPHAAPQSIALREVEVLKEYNDRLVFKLKEKNTELQAAEVKFRALVEQSIVGIYITQDDQFVYVNPSMTGIFGWSEKEMTSRTVFDFIVPEDHALVREYIRKRISGGVPGVHYSLRMLHQSGAVLEIDLHGSRTEYNGRPAMMGMLLDITERMRTENERRVIFEIIQGSLTTPNLDEFLNLIHRSISQIVYAENCFVMLHDPVTEMIHYEFWADKYDPLPPPRPAGKGFGSYVLRTGQPLLLTEESKKRMFDQGEAEQLGSSFASWLGVPLRTPSRTIGALVLQHYEDEHAYTERDLEFLSSVGDQIALAIERKRADEALSKSEESYRDLVENAIDMIYTLDLDGNYTSINRAAEKITGYTREETLTRNMAQSVAPEQREKIAAQMKASILSGTDTTAYELEIIAKDGRRVAVDVNTSIIHENGVPVGVQGIARDITARKRAEDSLKLFRALVDQSNDTIEVLDPETGQFLDVNEKGCLDLGYSREELLALSVFDVDSTVDQSVFQRDVEELRKSGVEMWEGNHRRKDGSTFPVEVNLKYVRLDRDYIVTVARDITERKLAEQAQQETQRRVEDIVHSVEGIVWEADARTFAFTFVSQQAERILGYPTERWLDEPAFWCEHIHPEDREAAVEFCMDSVNSMLPHQFEYRMLAQDGRDVWLKDVVTILAEAGRPVKLRGIMMDITERKRADQELRESEEKYRTILENIEDGYFEVDVAGNLTFFNNSLCGIFGYSRKELLGMNNRTFMDEQNARKVYQTFNKVYRTGKPAKAFDWEIIRKDGIKRSIEASVSQRLDSTGEPIGFRGVLRDITERKRAEEALRSSEEQLQQSGKMEAIGLLAGGIAHDFNNLLTAITGYSELTLRRLKADDPLRQNIEEIKRAGDRAAELTGQLLAFSRKQVLKPMVHNLNTVITDIERMLRRIIKESIELRTILDPELGNIKADPGQMEQVIMNLAVNARDAMPDGGTLTIQTQNVYLDEDYVSQHLTVSPGAFVKMIVTDTGAGMEEQTQEHIFEPFFTTKEVGKGTGLGLSTVYGIVKQSGGDLTVYSEIGHGTTFKIYLPCVDETVQKPKWAGNKVENYSGTETILLVEDEEIVRNLVREILTGNGYNVLEADSGKAALSICDTYSEPIHMLLTDVVMPKMGGTVLKSKIVKLLPDIRVLFMSGYTDDSITQTGILDSDTAFIEKPFTPDALARKVREVLES